MENEVVIRLRQVEKLLEDGSHWTTKLLARDRRGHPVLETSPEACQWCLMGAVEREFATAPARIHTKLAFDYISEAADELGFKGMFLGDINDKVGHGAVMDIIRKAIELASQ